MPPRVCSVTVTDSQGIRHAVEVTAESIYEAAVLALAAFRSDDWIEPPGPGTRLDVEARQPVVRHSITITQIQQWLDSGASSPSEQLRKQKLKTVLKG